MPERLHEAKPAVCGDVEDKMPDLDKELIAAAEEIRYLLGRGYPKNSAIRFVCDHHLLKEEQRFILSRNILAPAIASDRRNKRLICTDLKSRHVVIDGYNVLITLENYLKGEDMWTGDDGFIRDNRGVFSAHVNDETTCKALNLMIEMLVVHKVGSVIVFLDRQMSKSGELATFIRQKMEEVPIKGDVFTSGNVDNEIKRVSGNSIVATADGVIIDAVENVIDIPACVIAEREDQLFLHSLRPDIDHTIEGKIEV
ncbi:DUF434 domain-containing protein [Methanolobus sp. ZRKC2]|uniref:DUF434 domain-containing protein n=1 Tax=Methanolobus sp. ZRKC2 TaxID=3125783 RepID=UPI00324C2F27